MAVSVFILMLIPVIIGNSDFGDTVKPGIRNIRIME